ncbi:hypothetical protein F5976_04560 [Lacticaseibacillus rhamnosus]|nr:hypothetical protein F5976_04560 [Lacticaseibacillus rhamnosus]
MKVELSFAWIDKSRYNNCAVSKALTEKIEGQGFYILRELQVIPFLLIFIGWYSRTGLTRNNDFKGL